MAFPGGSWICSVMSNPSSLEYTDPQMVGKVIRALVDDAMCCERLVSYSCLLPLLPVFTGSFHKGVEGPVKCGGTKVM